MNHQLFTILLLAFPFAFPIAPAGGQAYSRTELPPLLEFLDGRKVRTPEDWNERRAEIRSLLAGGVGLHIVDVTDKSDMYSLSVTTYPYLEYCHQGWLSEDRHYLYVDDEADEGGGNVPTTRTLVFDVSDLEDPQLVSTFTSGLPSIDHNLYVRDRFIYEANYTSGLRIFDALDPIAPVEVAYFDSHPETDGLGFDGAWSTYPFFPSNVVLVSDSNRGLFVLTVCAATGCMTPPSLAVITAPYDSESGCAEFLWTLGNANTEVGPLIEEFYLDIEAGDGARQCADITPPKGWDVELCEGLDEYGHALYRFSGLTPLVHGERISGRLTIDTNGTQPTTNPVTGVTVPPLSVMLHAAQGQAEAECSFDFGPAENGEWGSPVVGAAFLPVPAMTGAGKVMLTIVLVAAGAAFVSRSRASSP